MEAAGHSVLQLNAVVPLLDYLPPVVNSFANLDNYRHGYPLAGAIANLISLGENFIALHHHVLLNNHAIGLVVLVFIQVTVLFELFIFCYL